jgi:hypothetical protein
MKNEQQVRKGLMDHAYRIGAQEDLQYMFDKWDRAIALAPESEKKDMSRAAILEVQALLDIRAEDGLTINDEIVIPMTSGRK